MTETMDLYTVPKTNGDAPLPRRAGARTMLPSTWVGRSLRLEYSGPAGEMRETSATLLDWCGMGPIFNIAGARTVLSWDVVTVIELVED